MPETLVVLDFGSQYVQLIIRRVRELGVYCEVLPHTVSAQELSRLAPAGLIFSGGPASVIEPEHPACDPSILQLGLPILGICYGMQLITSLLGGKVERGRSGEYGPASIALTAPTPLFQNISFPLQVWMSHGDQIRVLPPGFQVLAKTPTCPVAAMGDEASRIYGVQFHPEVLHTPKGVEILSNFLFSIAGCRGEWSMNRFIETQVAEIRARVGQARVICALSGGVDSAVVAALIHRAVGTQMKAIFVDNGLLREYEVDQIRAIFTRDYPIDLRIVEAADVFLEGLKGVVDPERKRKIIGDTFIRVFREEATRIQGAEFLAQGTLYPDVIESSSAHGGPSATIKSHHNVGGLPEEIGFQLIEPLRYLFKDEVRVLGRTLGLPESLIQRQPFPGPGLAVRILGEVTPENLALLRQADLVVQEEMVRYEGYDDIWQSFAILLPVNSVGVMGDERTYARVVALRVVTSRDAMTADWVKLPYELLGRISSRIINEVKGVNRVVYDISSKPPSTIEWE